MPWQAIQYVSSGLTLAAFVVAVIAWLVKSKTEQKVKLIHLAKEGERADLVRDALEFFHVDSAGLTKEQQYQLALEQIRARGQRFKILAMVVCVVAVLGAAVATYAITHPAAGAARDPAKDPTPTPPAYDALKEGESAAAAWFAAFKRRDLDTVVKLASPPFYYDNQILLTREDVRRRYSESFKGPKDLSQIQVTKIQVMTVADLKKTGGAAGDRILNSLRITDEDVVAAVYVGREAIAIYFRRAPNGLEMAGFWD